MSGFIFSPFTVPGFLPLGNQAGIVVLDGADATGWSLTAIGNVTLTPQNLVEGEKYSVRFTQDAVGDWTLSILGAVTAEVEGSAPSHLATFSTEYTLTATSSTTWEVTNMSGGETLAIVTQFFVGVAGIIELFCDPGQRTAGGPVLISNDWATSQGAPDPGNGQRTARWSLVAFGDDASVSRWIEMYCVGDGGIPNLPTTAFIDLTSAVVTNYRLRFVESAELTIGSLSGINFRFARTGGKELFGAFNVPPVFQQDDVIAFVDNTGGTVSDTIAAVPDCAVPLTAAALALDINANILPVLRDALASIAAKMTGPAGDSFRTCLRNLGWMA